MLHVKIVDKTNQGLRPFVQLPFDIYKSDPLFAPPIRKKVMAALLRRDNDHNGSIQRFFVAYKDEKPIARVMAGTDKQPLTGETCGWFGMFDTFNDIDGVRAVMDAAAAFLRERGATRIAGPFSPDNPMLNIGVLAEGFAGAPVLYNPYNKAYYVSLLEDYGFKKEKDYLAFDIPAETPQLDHVVSLAQRAQQRFGFRVEEIPGRSITLRLARDIAQVMTEADDDDQSGPTAQDVLHLFDSVRPVLRHELCVMAYAGSRPIGVMLAFPDNTPYLQALGGRETLLSLLRVALRGKNAQCVRCPIQHVVPEYHNKAVNLAMIVRALQNAQNMGVQRIEGSVVAEDNAASINNSLLIGGKVYRKYRTFSLAL